MSSKKVLDIRHLQPNFLAAAAMGAYSNASVINKFGYNAAVPATYEVMWEESIATPPYISTAIVMQCGSASTDDDVAGTGALTMKITGLDGDYLEVNDTVIMTGRTAVVTTQAFLRVTRQQILTAGSGGKNAGICYAGTGALTTGKPAVVHGIIGAGENQSLMGFTTIPAGVTGYMFANRVSSSVAKDIQGKVTVREEGGLFQVKNYVSLIDGQVGGNMVAPMPIPEKSDVQIAAKAAAAGGDMAGNFVILLIDN